MMLGLRWVGIKPMTCIPKHSALADHYRCKANAAMDSASTTQYPAMRADLLKLAAAWHHLAAEIDLAEI